MWIQCCDLLVQSKTQPRIVNCSDVMKLRAQLRKCCIAFFAASLKILIWWRSWWRYLKPRHRMLLTLMRCLDVRAQWVDKEGRKKGGSRRESFKGGRDRRFEDMWSPGGGGQCMCLSQRVSSAPPPKKKREIAQTTHHRWRFDSCLSPPTFALSNHTNFSLMRFEFEARQTRSSHFSKSCG